MKINFTLFLKNAFVVNEFFKQIIKVIFIKEQIIKNINFFSSRPLQIGVQRRQRRVLDTSSTYVRGEENLHGWRPRGDSLIFDHQWELEKLTRLEEVGRMRHLLLLRERLGMDTNPNPTTKTEKDVCNLAAKAATSPVHMVIPPSPQTPVKDPQQIIPEREYNEREKDLMNKCLKLIQGKLKNTKKK